MSSALVSYYGSSDEDDDDVNMDVGDYTNIVKDVDAVAAVIENEGVNLTVDVNSSTPSSLKLDSVLPKPKGFSGSEIKSGDIDVEIGPIPPKKSYGDEELQPKPSGVPNLTTKKSAKGVVQISIPSLKNFEEDEGDTKRRVFQSSQKGSGLFAILPEPKNEVIRFTSTASTSSSTDPVKGENESLSVNFKPKSSPLIPHVVQQSLAGKRSASPNQRLAQIKAKYIKQEANFKIVSKSSALVNSKSPNDSEEDEDSTDFLGLDSRSNQNLDETLVQDQTTRHRIPCEININPEVDKYLDPNSMEEESLPTPFEHQVETSDEPDLMKYIQPAKKGRGKATEINIIDVNADDLRPQTNDWLKTITDTSMIPPRKANLPGGLSKRKHQITYLAAEAKAREEELQNQWAQNRHARRTTQNKYGF